MKTKNEKTICIGHYAGYLLTDQKEGVIIGDNIKDFSPNQKDVLYLSSNFLIGKNIAGKICNLYDILTAKDINKGIQPQKTLKRQFLEDLADLLDRYEANFMLELRENFDGEWSILTFDMPHDCGNKIATAECFQDIHSNYLREIAKKY